MAFVQWRRFNFFDKEFVKDAKNEPFTALKDVRVAASAYGRGHLIIGDQDGFIYFLTKSLELTNFRAFEKKVFLLFQFKEYDYLLSVGTDDGDDNSEVLKIWDLSKMEKGGLPSCLRTTRIQPTSKGRKITAMGTHENLQFLAVGTSDGTVIVFKGELTKDKQSKPRVVHEGPHAITGLAFRQMTGKTMVLFVTTDQTILSIGLSTKDKESKEVLDKHGCALNCSTMTDATQDHQFVVGRPDAIYFYQVDSRGQCLVFEGEKVSIHWFRGYLIVVGKDTTPLASTLGQSREMNLITVYDIQNKLIAFTSPIPAVQAVFCEWGSLYFLAADGRLHHIREKDTRSKLDILFKKNLYQAAISLAKSQLYDEDGLVDIYRQFGDHLYNKQDFDAAIQQYSKTIGRLEPSYVIRKFLDTQRIQNLTDYLQALHRCQLATNDHTTLLLNCYAKLNQVAKLDEFIKTKDVEYDVETAIRVCRQSGYHTHALFLCERHQRHDLYLKILLEDIKDYAKALQYIGKLDPTEAKSNLVRYGKELLTHVPDQTTQLLVKLCTETKPASTTVAVASNPFGDDEVDGRFASTIEAEDFIPIFVKNPVKLIEFLEQLVKVNARCSSTIYNTLIELYLHAISTAKSAQEKQLFEKKTMTILESSQADYDVDQALLRCQMSDFKDGILYLYKKSGVYQQILRYHMEHNEHTHVLDTCQRFGDQDPLLWVQALSYFARNEECKSQIQAVLDHIERRNLMPPLLVVQTLAHNSEATIGVVKDYLLRHLQKETKALSDDEKLIQQHKDETEKIRHQVEQLKTQPVVFQTSRCSICNQALDLPSVHFLCQHSYHQHCFEGYTEENECPACAPENKKTIEILRAQEQSRVAHDQFHSRLDKTSDGFGLVAEYFGRGMFNKVLVVTKKA